MTLSVIQTIAHKALTAADTSYHTWSAEQQENFRATMDNKTRQYVRAILLQEIKGIASTPDNIDELWDDLSIGELYELNEALLLTQGIGEDWVFLNEYMGEGISLLDFETLYDYDFDNHLFQERANTNEDSDYQPRDYYALRWICWMRLLFNDRLCYANLYSLAQYVVSHLEDKGFDKINELIPHDYFPGEFHNEVTKDGLIRWDMRVNANGQEKQLDELHKRWYQYQQERWITLSQHLSQQAPVVYQLDTSEMGEVSRDFVFNNEAALKQVRWRHFLADCKYLRASEATVLAIKEQEWALAEKWLEETYQAILQDTAFN